MKRRQIKVCYEVNPGRATRYFLNETSTVLFWETWAKNKMVGEGTERSPGCVFDPEQWKWVKEGEQVKESELGQAQG